MFRTYVIAASLTVALVVAGTAGAAHHPKSHLIRTSSKSASSSARSDSYRVIYLKFPAMPTPPTPWVDPNACENSGNDCTDLQACEYWGENCGSLTAADLAGETGSTDPSASDQTTSTDASGT